MANQQTRRQYDKQFKIDAVELTLKGDKAARTCNSVSHLLKSVVREIRTLRCVGAGFGRPALRPGGYRVTGIPTATP